MRAIRKSFFRMVGSVRKDAMLFAACFAPVIAGLAFHFGIPQIEKWLCSFLGKESVLTSYYSLFDIFLSIIAPMLFCFVAAMVMLEERDDKITRYLIVTPLGKKGYLFSRLGMIFIISAGITVPLLWIFKLSGVTFGMVLFLSVAGAMQGIIMALLMVTLSSNRLEGIAISKLSTLFMMGFVVPYFIKGKIMYILVFFPSFWIGKTVYHEQVCFMIPTALISFAWIALFLRGYVKKSLQ